MLSKKLILITGFFILLLKGYGQILDDSTTQLYGPKTTFYTTEEDILNTTPVKRTIDSSINDLHNFPVLFGRNFFYQDLGVIGTPINYYSYQMPERPGRRFGFDAFDPYMFSPSTIRYYDTRSPYTQITYLQGSRGQQLAQANFSRNINFHWNVGFDYRILSSKKTVGFERRDPLTLSNAFDFYTRFFSPKSGRYELLANFSFYDQQFQEYGGIKPDSSDQLIDLYDDIREDIFLRDALSNIKKFQYRVYQHFDLFKDEKVQIYNIFDYLKRNNWYKQRNLTNDLDYLDSLNFSYPPRYSTLSVFNESRYTKLEDEAGIKGKFNKFNYRLFYRFRDLFYSQNYVSTNLAFTENFLGGRLTYDLKDSVTFLAYGEKMLNGDDYSLKAEFHSKHFDAGYNRVVYSPSMFQLLFTGSFIQWSPDSVNLLPTQTDRLFVGARVEKERYFVRANINYYTIKNYIYLNPDKLREQAATDQLVQPLSANIDLGVNFFNLHLENYSRLNNVSGKNGGEDLLRLPELVNRSRLYYQNKVLGDVAFFQIGVDLNYRSGYFADKYLPNYQHYYLNNDFPLQDYMYLDAFINVRIKRAMGYIKVVNVTENLTEDVSYFGPGYFITPGYTGLPRTFYFGIIWRFYN